MIDLLDELEVADAPFGIEEEEAVLSLALDHPEFFAVIGNFITPDIFSNLPVRFVIANLLKYQEKYGVIPTRNVLRARISKQLTADDPYEEILEVIDRPSNPREVPIIKDELQKWAEFKTYNLLYDDASIDAFHRGDYDHLKEIVSKAGRLADVGQRGFWLFKQYEQLFEDEAMEHITCGFQALDRDLNNGGPSPGEVLVWMAPTGVGKSIMLCHNATACVQAKKNVLYITYELSAYKAAIRMIGGMLNTNTSQIKENKEKISAKLNSIHSSLGSDLVIYEFPPGECSVDNIYALCDSLGRTDNWHPDVICIDYLELMISRNDYYNRDDYVAQKHVSTEIRGLAKNENVVVFTATQANRDGMHAANGKEAATIGLEKVAESYGKTMPVDYVISVNQTLEEYRADVPSFRLFVAKNRDGKKFHTVRANVNYSTMKVGEFGHGA